MGSAQSFPSAAAAVIRPQYTQMEQMPSGGAQTPAVLSQKGDAPPQLIRVESFGDKFIRKFTTQPLVPLGCCATTYFLVAGINSFKNQDAVRSQKMMRLRVGAQLATIVVFVGYVGWEKGDWRLAPKWQDAQDKKKAEAGAAGGGTSEAAK